MRFQPCREGAAGDKITMQNGPKNGAFFAVKLRTRTPAHRREGAPQQHRQRQQHSPPPTNGGRGFAVVTGGCRAAHTRRKNPGAEIQRSTGPASKVPAHTPAGRAHGPRTRNANTTRGGDQRQSCAACPPEHRAAGREGERPPGPHAATPAVPAPKYPRRKNAAGGRAYKVPAQAAPAILRTQSAQAIKAEADKERGPRSGPRSETRLSLYQQPRSTGQAARLYSPTGPARQPCPPPPALESFRGLALMPRVPSNVKNIPRSAARKMGAPSARSDRPARTWPELRP